MYARQMRLCPRASVSPCVLCVPASWPVFVCLGPSKVGIKCEHAFVYALQPGKVLCVRVCVQANTYMQVRSPHNKPVNACTLRIMHVGDRRPAR